MSVCTECPSVVSLTTVAWLELDYRVEYSSAVLYIACTGRHLVNTLCTDNSPELRGYLDVGVAKGARKSKIVSSDTLTKQAKSQEW